MILDQARLPLATVLLAAGHGRRAGGPKALKRTPAGELWWLAQAKRIAGDVQWVVAVLHPHCFPLPDHVVPGLTACRGDADATLLHSLQTGLLALGPLAPQAQAVLALPVDCPWPGRAVADALWRTARRSPHFDAVRPQVLVGSIWRRGHPILITQQGVADVVRLDPDRDRMDHWLASSEHAVSDVAVADLAILANFNGDGMSA